MVQLKVLSGRKAGPTWVARHFPVRIGRSATADLQLEEDGVWDRHLELGLDSNAGIVLSALPDALTTVNGQSVHQAILRNGDAIAIGSLRMQFWLSETRQVGWGFREALTGAAIATISLGQVGLIYWLLH
jgi:pSer/pThr/pTyr-binding forkhead associated (FHA) protein